MMNAEKVVKFLREFMGGPLNHLRIDNQLVYKIETGIGCGKTGYRFYLFEPQVFDQFRFVPAVDIQNAKIVTNGIHHGALCLGPDHVVPTYITFHRLIQATELIDPEKFQNDPKKFDFFTAAKMVLDGIDGAREMHGCECFFVNRNGILVHGGSLTPAIIKSSFALGEWIIIDSDNKPIFE